MEKSGINVNMVRAQNLRSILYFLNSHKNVSRKDVAEGLNLTPAAVSKLCTQLIGTGLIEETGEEESKKAGRKKIILRLKLDCFFALGINAEVDNITISVVRLDKKPIIFETVKITTDTDKIVAICKRLIKNCGIDAEKIVCASLCVPGSPDNDSYNLFDCEKLKDALETKLNLAVTVENNIRSYALAEQIYANNDESQTTLYLKWGPGIGSVISANGELVASSGSSVAEIGHYIVRKDGAKCRCGRYGCLETEVSSMAIIEDAGGKMSFGDIIKSEKREIINLIDEKTDLVALALANTATILNAEKIILFGTVFFNRSIAEKLSRQCRRYNINLKPNSIILSSFNDSMSYIGPAALAAKNYFFEKPLREG